MPSLKTSDGVNLNYHEAGSGTPVIFVHEFAGDARSWEPQIRHFSRAYRCIAFNARGYPPSDVPTDGAMYSQDHARDDILAVLDGLNIDDLQQLTDKLFEEYKADLAAKGFEIAPIEELWNHSAYEKNREKRWDLRSGQGGEKGDEFGDIVMRPTGQKFIVAKQNMENKKIVFSHFVFLNGKD